MGVKATNPIDLITPEFVAKLNDEQRAELYALLKIRAQQLGLKPAGVPWGFDDPRDLLRLVAPQVVSKPFAPEHTAFWEWVWKIEPGVRPEPLVVCMSRGRGKSTSIELASSLLLAHGRRRFVWYVSRTQQLADAHVEAIASLFESDRFQERYPFLRPKLGKFGNQRAWRRQRLMADGPDGIPVTVEAVGLETGTRGVKAEFQRPDLILLDDVDSESHSPEMVLKLLNVITQAVIPAGSDDAALAFVQNMVHANSLIRRVIEPEEFPPEERWMTRATIVGPTKAIDDCVIEILPDPENPGRTRPTIVAGTPTWEGQDLEQMQDLLDRIGIRSFETEMQNSIKPRPGGVFSHVEFRHCKYQEVPWGRIVQAVVAVDPAVTETDGSDATGIQVDCVADNGEIYRLFSWEQRCSPTNAIRTALLKAHNHGASTLGVEVNQGGETWLSVVREAYRGLIEDGLVAPDWRMPKLIWLKAPSNKSKVERAQAMVPDYERGAIIHVLGDTTKLLEDALYRFPLTEPDDLTDSAAYAWYMCRRIRKAPAIGKALSVGTHSTLSVPSIASDTTLSTRERLTGTAEQRAAAVTNNMPTSWSVGEQVRWRA